MPKPFTTMEEGWESFIDSIFTDDTRPTQDSIQYRMMRSSFYSGAMVLRRLIESTPDGEEEDAAVKKLMDELSAFCLNQIMEVQLNQIMEDQLGSGEGPVVLGRAPSTKKGTH